MLEIRQLTEEMLFRWDTFYFNPAKDHELFPEIIGLKKVQMRIHKDIDHIV